MNEDFLKGVDFHPVMDTPENIPEVNFSNGFEPAQLLDRTWGIGGYKERRKGMYTAPQYKNERNIHMGVDIWAPAGRPVYSIYNGRVAYVKNHRQEGNYGPMIIVHYEIGDIDLYALYGHLSKNSLEYVFEGYDVKKGECIGELGQKEENGGWHPHLHFQLSLQDPGEPDMPGVVAEDELEAALKTYPDPIIVLGTIDS